MSSLLLDSSVVLAVLFDEPGHERADSLAQGALMSSVNIAEVVTKCIGLRFPEETALSYMEASGIIVVDFNHDLAVMAGLLARRARHGVLSLGDRACIATAIRMNATAVTADRIWADLNIGCKIELIR